MMKGACKAVLHQFCLQINQSWRKSCYLLFIFMYTDKAKYDHLVHKLLIIYLLGKQHSKTWAPQLKIPTGMWCQDINSKFFNQSEFLHPLACFFHSASWYYCFSRKSTACAPLFRRNQIQWAK